MVNRLDKPSILATVEFERARCFADVDTNALCGDGVKTGLHVRQIVEGRSGNGKEPIRRDVV